MSLTLALMLAAQATTPASDPQDTSVVTAPPERRAAMKGGLAPRSRAGGMSSSLRAAAPRRSRACPSPCR